MVLNFILGNSQKNHQEKLVQKFITDYQDNPKDKFFFIVPNHIKFESEIKIIKQFKEALNTDNDIIATSNLQIFSLSRLAWYFLRDEEVLNRQTITTTKKSMIIRDILNKQSKSLKIFKGEVGNNGFIDEIIKQIEELQSGQIEVEDLDRIISNLDSTFEIQKMTELKAIYNDFLNFINDNYLHNNLLMEKLLEFFKKDNNLKGTHFYVYGFSSFKSSEFLLLNEIAQNSELSISLELDKPYIELPEPTEFYYRSARTYERLYSAARTSQVVINNEYAENLRVSDDLALLENFWIESNSNNKEIKDTPLTNKSSIQIWQSSDRQTELQAIATYIRQMVATQESRFKDFLILSRDLSGYESFIKPIFDINEVPMFFDLQSNMAQHPMKLLIDYLFEFASGNLNHESIFQMLKLDLLRPNEEINDDYFQSALDITENYSLSRGLFKKDWLSNEEFVPEANFDDMKEGPLKEKIQMDYQKINFIKKFVRTLYSEISDIFTQSKSNKEAIIGIYSFIDKYQVFKTLRKWQNRDIDDGNLLNADKPEQVVGVLNQILNEFVEIFGDYEFKKTEFLQVLDSGFSQAQYSQIPATLDAVNISELGMVQMNDRKITFILGGTSELMPKATTNNSLISDEEKKVFTQYLKKGSEFSDSAEVINNDEPFLHNSAFISSSQRVIFTYSQMNADSQEQISPYLQRIQDHFKIEPRIVTNTPNLDDKYALSYVGSMNSTMNYLIRLNRSLRTNNAEMSHNWKIIQDIILNDENSLKKINDSLNYKNTVSNLEPEVAHQLYGDTLNVSISQLETFYRNEYEYFLRYGLKLKTRDVFELTSASMGSFFHENLDEFIKYIVNNKIDLKTQTVAQTEAIVKEVFNKTLATNSNKLFTSTPQMKYVTQEIGEILKGLLTSVNTQASLLNFSPFKSEITFGSIRGNTGISGLSYQLNDQKKINVRGKIDRLDKFNNSDALQIIDYKSSDKKFDYTLFNSGLQMQLTTYIQAALNDLPQLEANNILGAFYSRIYNPVNNATYIKKENRKDRQLTGIIIDDDKNIDQLVVNGLDKRNSSDIYKLRLTKDGNPSSTEILTKDQLNQILSYNKKMIINAASSIYSGEVKLNPYRIDDKKTGLQYSDFKSIFEFDAMLPENRYREIPSITKKQMLERLTQEGDINGN